MNPPSTAELLLDAASSDNIDPELRSLLIDAANELSQAIERSVALERTLRSPIPPKPARRVDHRDDLPPILSRGDR